MGRREEEKRNECLFDVGQEYMREIGVIHLMEEEILLEATGGSSR